MRPLLYLLSFVLALPGVGLAAVFLILGGAISTQSLAGFLGVLLDVAVILIPWGLLALFALFTALLLGGLSARFRWFASACVALLAISSSIVVLALTARHDNFRPDQLGFFVPALLSASISIWIAAREWPPRAARRIG